MKTVNLKFQGGMELKPTIEIDGKIADFKKNKHEAILISHQTENDFITIMVKNTLEVKGPCWWLVQMAFFIFSIFGILNPILQKNYFEIIYQAKIYLPNEKNEIMFKFNPLKDGEKAIQVMTDAQVEEKENKYVFDAVAKKRNKILGWSFAISWVILICVVSLILYFTLR